MLWQEICAIMPSRRERERMFEGMGNYRHLAFGSLCLRCEVCAKVHYWVLFSLQCYNWIQLVLCLSLQLSLFSCVSPFKICRTVILNISDFLSQWPLVPTGFVSCCCCCCCCSQTNSIQKVLLWPTSENIYNTDNNNNNSNNNNNNNNRQHQSTVFRQIFDVSELPDELSSSSECIGKQLLTLVDTKLLAVERDCQVKSVTWWVCIVFECVNRLLDASTPN